MAVIALLDPLGVSVVSSANGDLGGDAPIVVLIPDGTEQELEATVSLAFEALGAVL